MTPAVLAADRAAQTAPPVTAPAASMVVSPPPVRHSLVASEAPQAPPAPWRVDPFSMSEQIDQLVPALAAAQLAFGTIEKKQRAEVESKRTGGKYTYDYADIADVLTVVRPVLAEKGIAIVQAPVTVGRAVGVITLLAHASGQFVRNHIAVALDSADPQAIGSAITYLRRYALQSLVGVAPEEDTDAAKLTPPARRESAGPSGPPTRPGQGPVQMPQRHAAPAPPAGAHAAPSSGIPPAAAPAAAPPAPASVITIEALEQRTATSGAPYWLVAFSNGVKGCTFSTTIGEALTRGRATGVVYDDVVWHRKGNYTYIDELLPVTGGAQ